jgi:DnaJ-class molecular chaperone
MLIPPIPCTFCKGRAMLPTHIAPCKASAGIEARYGQTDTGLFNRYRVFTCQVCDGRGKHFGTPLVTYNIFTGTGIAGI